MYKTLESKPHAAVRPNQLNKRFKLNITSLKQSDLITRKSKISSDYANGVKIQVNTCTSKNCVREKYYNSILTDQYCKHDILLVKTSIILNMLYSPISIVCFVPLPKQTTFNKMLK